MSMSTNFALNQIRTFQHPSLKLWDGKQGRLQGGHAAGLYIHLKEGIPKLRQNGTNNKFGCFSDIFLKVTKVNIAGMTALYHKGCGTSPHVVEGMGIICDVDDVQYLDVF